MTVAILILFCIFAYCFMGMATLLCAAAMNERHRNLSTASQWSAAIFWPGGVWFLLGQWLIASRSENYRQGFHLTAEQRERQRRILQEREDLRLDIEEQKNIAANERFRKMAEEKTAHQVELTSGGELNKRYNREY